MNTIFEKQSEGKFLKLYAAASQVYDEGKRINKILFTLTLLGALVLPVLDIFYDDYNDSINLILGVLGAGLTLYLGRLPDKKKETGAKIQEQFDTELYDMPWNQDVVGSPPVDPYLVSQKSIEYGQKNIEKLKAPFEDKKWRWYGNYDQLPHNHAVLSCQKENLYWDERQKGEYAQFLLLCSCFVLLFGVLLYKFFVVDKDIIDYLSRVLSVQSPLIIHLFSMYFKNKDNTVKLRSEMARVQDIRKQYLENPNGATSSTNQEILDNVIRSVQNTIYRNRSTGMLVPTWFYKFKTKIKYQRTLDDVAEAANSQA